MTTIITNATLIPCTPDMPVIEGGFVHVEGERIVAAGAGPAPRFEGAEVVDVGGDIVMPGMVNPHCHMAMTLFRGLGEDVDDRLYRYVLPMERKFVTPQMVRAGTALAALELIEGGVTTVADMYYFETEVGRVVDQAGIRGVVGQTIADFNPPDHKTIDEGFALTEALVDEFAGHPRVTASIAPHAPYSTDIAVMNRVARWADDHPDVPVQIHLAEMDSEMEWCAKNHNMRPVEVVEKAGLLRKGLICAHCLHVSDSDIEKMAHAQVCVAHNARSNAKAGRRHRASGGDARGGHSGRRRDGRADERQHARPVLAVRAGDDVPEAAGPQPQADAGEGSDPHGDHRRREGAGHGWQDRLAGAWQAGRSDPHRRVGGAHAADLRSLCDAGVLGDAGGRARRDGGGRVADAGPRREDAGAPEGDARRAAGCG